MKTKKLLSILLALMMMLSVVPMYASAAEPIALTEANVTVWPTASGEIYFGQKISDGITLSGGEVQYDGAVVAGHFEFTNPDFCPTSAGNQIASLAFIPNDSSVYVGFDVDYAWDVTYKVNKTTPVLVSESDLPIATEVEAGAQLKTSVISGGAMKNPYNDSEPNINKAIWEWTNRRTIINESGYYEAEFVAKGYEIVTREIYVKIAGETPETTIAEYPTIPELTYNPDVTWADIELTGGKAVIKGTETEVAGTFAIKDTRLAATPNPNFTEIEVVFTPDDPEAALPYEFTIPVKVNPAHISFVDGEGNVVEDFTFEVEPGTKMNDIKALITTNLLKPKNAVISVEDNNAYAQNGRKYKLTVLHDDPYYVGKELYFTVKFKDVELTPTFAPGYLKSSIICGDYRPAGTFTVSLDGKEIAEVKANEEFTYTVENSGDHIFSAKYNPSENDYFIIADFETTVNVKLKRLLTCANTVADVSNTYYLGDKVEISANIAAENFAGWKITDAKGNEVDLGVDLTATEISFTMPDYDIHVEALEKNASSSDGDTDLDIDLDLDFDGSHKFDFVNLIQNLIAKLKAFIQQIGDFFSNMSLEGLGNITG